MFIDEFLQLQDVTLKHLRELKLIIGTRTNFPLEYFLQNDGMNSLYIVLKNSPFLINNKSSQEIELIHEVILVLKCICLTKVLFTDSPSCNKFIVGWHEQIY